MIVTPYFETKNHSQNYKYQMEQENSFTGQESFDIINKMIQRAQNKIDDSSFYYLFWGWLVLIASIANFIMLKMELPNPFLPWVLMPLGGVVTGIYSYKNKKSKVVSTYLDDLMKYVVTAFLISLAIVLFFMSKLGLSSYPMIMMIYAIWLFISGGALKFKPLIIGGIINWVLAITAFFFEFDVQLLLISAAVLMGYIVPGYMLKSRSHKSIPKANSL